MSDTYVQFNVSLVDLTDEQTEWWDDVRKKIDLYSFEYGVRAEHELCFEVQINNPNEVRIGACASTEGLEGAHAAEWLQRYMFEFDISGNICFQEVSWDSRGFDAYGVGFHVTKDGYTAIDVHQELAKLCEEKSAPPK